MLRLVDSFTYIIGQEKCMATPKIVLFHKLPFVVGLVGYICYIN